MCLPLHHSYISKGHCGIHTLSCFSSFVCLLHLFVLIALIYHCRDGNEKRLKEFECILGQLAAEVERIYVFHYRRQDPV